VHIVYALVAVTFLLVVQFFGISFVSNVFAFAPIFESFKALRHPERLDETDHWLTYWMVYGSFVLTESFTNALSLWIPFYHVFKIVFYFWLFLPQTKGAETVYNRVLGPALDRWEVKIDKGLEASEKIAKAAAEDEARDIGERARKSINVALVSVQQQVTKAVVKEILHEQLGQASAPEPAPSAPSPVHAHSSPAHSPAHARQASGGSASPSAPEPEHLGEEGEVIEREHVEGHHDS